MSNDLPAGWEWQRLSDLAAQEPNAMTDGPFGSHLKTADYVSDGAVRVIRLGNIGVGKFIDDDRSFVSMQKFEGLRKHEARPGDLVIAALAEPVGRSMIVPDFVGLAMVKADCVRLRVNPIHDNKYVMHALNSPQGLSRAEATAHGTGRLRINLGEMRDLRVPVAPPAEQKRLVAKLDSLRSRSRAAKETLDEIPGLLERFRRSVLAAAFRGDLTAEWRAKNPDVEPASELLKRIRAERRRRWEETELAKMKAKGKSADDRWKAKYEAPAPPDTNGLPDLPEGWTWCSVEELCPAEAPVVYGIIQPGEDVPNGVPYLRPVDIDPDGTIDFKSVKRTSPEIAAQYARASLQTGDIVLSIVGTIGKVIITPPELANGNITQSSARLRPPSWMPSEYLRLVLFSPQLTRQYDKVRFGNAVQRLNIEHVRRLAIPIPPLQEIPQIIATTTRAMNRIPTATIKAIGALLPLLEAQILAKAFRGELVAQDPSDEPAAALLARIAQQRDSASPDSPPAGRSRRRGPKP